MGNTSKNKPSSKNGKPAPSTAFSVSKDPVIRAKTGMDAHKFEVTREPAPVPPQQENLGELPQGYGSNTIYLIARDPRWLFTYWDIDWSRFPAEKMARGERKIFLKIFCGDREESSVEINPEAKNWYLPVNEAGANYQVELGYFGKRGGWKSIARSNEAGTPADTLSNEPATNFATVPLHLTFERLLDMVHSTMGHGESLIAALSRLQGEGRRLAFAPGVIPDWTEDQKRILASLVGEELVAKISMGSGEIDQILRKQLQEKLHSESASGLSIEGRLAELALPGESSLFSAMGASWSAQPFSVKRERGFFMHVNAEVIFYGGTDPDATVTIDGKKIALQPDGTFRYHFKFPDGNYQIPIVAQSPDKVEERSATLNFERATARTGDVKSTGQPRHLRKPMGRKK
jgi:hypothetical protein